MKYPPGPKKTPVVGHLKGFKKDPIQFMLDAADKFGPVVLFEIFNKKVYFINHPDYVKQVLQIDYKMYVKSPGYKPLRELGGMGIFTSDGEKWIHQRKLYQPALSPQAIEGYARIVLQQTDEMIASWKNAKGPINISREMMGVTLGVLSESLFSYKIDHNSDVYDSLTYALWWVNDRIMKAPLNWPVNFPVHKNIKFKKAVRTLDEIAYQAIEQKKNGKNNNDLLDRFMHPDDDVKPLNKKELRDELMTIFIAGHETSANVLMWAFYEIAKNPEIQHKIKDEVLALPNEISYQSLHKLEYTTQVLEETMRLYPPVWHLGRMNLEPTTIGEYEIPKNSHIRMSPLVLHRTEKYFSNPNVFDPRRFDKSKKTEIDKYAYIPFGAGPRLCAGRNFAMMEMVLIVAKVMQQIQFNLPEKKHELAPLMTLRPKNDILLQKQ